MKTPHFWQSNNFISAALLPASLIYRAGAWIDRTHATPKRAPVPVISIGNVTAGGAGKTPTTLALIPILRALGHTPHILTRGYGGTKLNAHRVTLDDDWHHVGDEALLLAASSPTWVGRNRLASAHAAAKAGATILVCDDALQHHALYKDISLLVIDGPYGLGNGQLLPAGPMRETLANALKRCDAAIIIDEDAQHLATRMPVPIFAASMQPSVTITNLKTEKWLAFAGIGRPEKFFDSLHALGANIVETCSFSDHYAYTQADVATLSQRAANIGARLITTTKDAVKLPPADQKTIAVLPVELGFANPDDFVQFLARKIDNSTAS